MLSGRQSTFEPMSSAASRNPAPLGGPGEARGRGPGRRRGSRAASPTAGGPRRRWRRPRPRRGARARRRGSRRRCRCRGSACPARWATAAGRRSGRRSNQPLVVTPGATSIEWYQNGCSSTRALQLGRRARLLVQVRPPSASSLGVRQRRRLHSVRSPCASPSPTPSAGRRSGAGPSGSSRSWARRSSGGATRSRSSRRRGTRPTRPSTGCAPCASDAAARTGGRHEADFGRRVLPAPPRRPLRRRALDGPAGRAGLDPSRPAAPRPAHRHHRPRAARARTFWGHHGKEAEVVAARWCAGIDVYGCMSQFALDFLARDYGRTDGVVTPGGVDLGVVQPRARARRLRRPCSCRAPSPSRARALRRCSPPFRSSPSRSRSVAAVAVGPGRRRAAARRRAARRAGAHDGARRRRARPSSSERYGRAWATVLPSTDDSFGMALIESHACGTPIVVSTHGAPQELVDVGRHRRAVRAARRGGLRGRVPACVRARAPRPATRWPPAAPRPLASTGTRPSPRSARTSTAAESRSGVVVGRSRATTTSGCGRVAGRESDGRGVAHRLGVHRDDLAQRGREMAVLAAPPSGDERSDPIARRRGGRRRPC